MSAFVAADVAVRHLTNDPPDLAEHASAYFGSARDLLLTDVVAAEVVYVLEYVYEAPREMVATAVRSLLMFEAVVCVDAALLLRALEIYETEYLDFAEAYLVASAETTGVGRVATFERSVEGVLTVQRIEPAS